MNPSARKHEKLAAALKRNMARRKEAGKQFSNEAPSAGGSGVRSVSEPRSGRGQRSVGDKVPFHHKGEAQ